MQRTMKAGVEREAANDSWMERFPSPEIGPNDVLVKLEKIAKAWNYGKVVCSWN